MSDSRRTSGTDLNQPSRVPITDSSAQGEAADWLDLFPAEAESSTSPPERRNEPQTFVIETAPVAPPPQRRKRRRRWQKLRDGLREAIAAMLRKSGHAAASAITVVMRGVIALALLPARLLFGAVVGIGAACQRLLLYLSLACRALARGAAAALWLLFVAPITWFRRALVATALAASNTAWRVIEVVRRIYATGRRVAIELRRRTAQAITAGIRTTVALALLPGRVLIRAIIALRVAVHGFVGHAVMTGRRYAGATSSGARRSVAYIAAWHRALAAAVASASAGALRRFSDLTRSGYALAHRLAARGRHLVWQFIQGIYVGGRSAFESLRGLAAGSARLLRHTARRVSIGGKAVLVAFHTRERQIRDAASQIARAAAATAAASRARLHVGAGQIQHAALHIVHVSIATAAALGVQLQNVTHRIVGAASHGASTGVTSAAAFRNRLHRDAKRIAQGAARRADDARHVLRATETAMVSSTARFYRAAAFEMSTTVLVVRIPTGGIGVPHIGRVPLLASAMTMLALALAASLVRTGQQFLERSPQRTEVGAADAPALSAAIVQPVSVQTTFAAPVPQRLPVARPVVSNVTLVARDRRAIQVVLNRYRDAMSMLDVEAVRSIYPAAKPEVLETDFSSLVEQNLEFYRCRISPATRGASAACAGVIESGFEAGRRRPHVARTRWEFRLQKTGNRWTLTRVDTWPL